MTDSSSTKQEDAATHQKHDIQADLNRDDDDDSSAEGTYSSSSLYFRSPVVGEVNFGSSWEQRWQTLAQFSCSLNFIIPMSILCWTMTLFCFVYAYFDGHDTNSWSRGVASILALYLGFILVVDNAECTGARTPFLRHFRWWWNKSCDYLPITLVKTADLPVDGNDGGSNNYVLGYHPHGVISVGCFGSFATDGARTLDLSPRKREEESATHDTTVQRGFSSLFPGLDRRVVTLDQNFGTPFLREYFLHMGSCCAKKDTFRHVLARPNTALVLVVGGATESLYTQQGSINLVLERRLGFVREAIKANASLVPVIAYGENDLYNIVDTRGWRWIPKFQDFVKRQVGVGMPLFSGRGILFQDFGVMPKRGPVVVVVGAPIAPPPLKKDPRDFDPQIDRHSGEAQNEDGEILKAHHAKYKKALEALYDEYKDAEWNTPGKNRRQSLKIVK